MVFHELAKAGISKQKLAFAINNVITDAEEAAARRYLSKAGYQHSGRLNLPVKNSYRDAHNHGRAITETKYTAKTARPTPSFNPSSTGFRPMAKFPNLSRKGFRRAAHA